MTRTVTTAMLLFSLVAVISCEPRPRYHERGYGERYGRHEPDFDDAWDVVRRDPCRYDEYRRYAENHKNAEKRRAVVWRLAREGCSRERSYGYEYER